MTEPRAVQGSHRSQSPGNSSRAHHPRPAPRPLAHSAAAPRLRRAPIGPSRDRRDLSIFPPSPARLGPNPAPAHSLSALPCLRAPPFRTPQFIPTPPANLITPRCPSRPFSRRWEGTERGGPSPLRGGRGRQGRKKGRGQSPRRRVAMAVGRGEEGEEASRRGMWCCRGSHRSCRCLLVAASSRRRLLEATGSSCGALPYCVFPGPSLASPLRRPS